MLRLTSAACVSTVREIMYALQPSLDRLQDILDILTPDHALLVHVQQMIGYLALQPYVVIQIADVLVR